MASTLSFFLWLSALVLVAAVEPESCVPTYPKITISELNGKVWFGLTRHLKNGVDFPDVFKCQMFTFAIDKTGKVGNATFSHKNSTGDRMKDIVLSLKQSDANESILIYNTSLEAHWTALFFNEIGVVIKQSYSIDDKEDYDLVVATFTKDVDEEQIDNLLKGACIIDKEYTYKVNNKDC